MLIPTLVGISVVYILSLPVLEEDAQPLQAP